MTNLEISSAAAEPNAGSLARRCVMGAGILGILIVVSAIANGLWLKILTSVAIYTLTAASIALLYRRLGLVSLAQVAMMGIGGWVALRLAHGTNLPFEMNVLVRRTPGWPRWHGAELSGASHARALFGAGDANGGWRILRS